MPYTSYIAIYITIVGLEVLGPAPGARRAPLPRGDDAAPGAGAHQLARGARRLRGGAPRRGGVPWQA